MGSCPYFPSGQLWVHVHIFHDTHWTLLLLVLKSLLSLEGTNDQDRKRDRQTINYIETEREREKTPESWLPIQPA